VRIASLLPSATEILYALGAGEELVAVSEKCDYPVEARRKTVVVRSVVDDTRPQGEIDAQVNRLLAAGESLYQVDTAALTKLQCDLWVTQDVCHVCAASPHDLDSALACAVGAPLVVALNPRRLTDVWADIMRLGAAIAREPRAAALVAELEARTAPAPATGQRMLCLEWFDPPFLAGHWVPDMVARAGAVDVMGRAGEPGFPSTWKEILASDPEIIVLMPCGYHLNEVVAQCRACAWPDGWGQLTAVRAGNVFAVDASGQFSRHGPRLADGVETLRQVVAASSSRSVAAAGSDWRRVETRHEH
jgi:iron complex transport system substrate-binding protein